MGGCITHIDRGEDEVGAKMRFRKSEDLGREKTERVRYGIKSGGTNAPDRNIRTSWYVNRTRALQSGGGKQCAESRLETLCVVRWL